MSNLAVTDRGPDAARFLAHVILSGDLSATESGKDTAGSTLMQQIASVLAPLAAGGAWPGRFTLEPVVYPYITFFRVIRPNNISFEGPSDLQQSRIQIDAFSLRYAEAAAVVSAARLAMLKSFVVGSIDEQDFPPDPDTNSFRCSADFNVWSGD